MERSLEAGGANVSGRLLDPVLITQLPSKSYQWLLVLLGLTLILFLCALHWAGHAIWHYLDHYLGHYWGNASASCIILTLVAAYYLRQFERPELSAPRGETGKLDALDHLSEYSEPGNAVTTKSAERVLRKSVHSPHATTHASARQAWCKPALRRPQLGHAHPGHFYGLRQW